MNYTFDAEPLIALALDEPKSDTVEKYLTEVADRGSDTVGNISIVTAVELRYITMSKATESDADELINKLDQIGINFIQIGNDVLIEASRMKKRYQIALGDAFALATASATDSTLVVGADDDFNGLESTEDIVIEQFRSNSA